MLTKEQAAKLMEAANKAGWQMKPAAELKEKVLTGALRSYASGVRREDVLAVYDTTVFGGGKAGFLLTAEALYNDVFPLFHKKDGATTRLPLEGLKSIRAVPGNKYDHTVRYQDGSSVTIYVYDGDRDGLRALLNAAIKLEQPAAPQPAAPEPAPAPEQHQAAQPDETDRLLAEYRARLEEMAKAAKAAEEAQAAAEARAAEAEAKVKAEAEAKAKAEAEAKAKAEAEAKARAEAEAKARAEAEAKARAEASPDADALYQEGKAQMKAQDWDAVIRCWTRAAELGNADAMKGLCDFYLAGSIDDDCQFIPSSEPYIDPKQAIFWGTRAMERGVDMARYIVAAYQQLGQNEEAYSFGKQAVTDGWKAQWAMMHLCIDLERYEEAISWGEKWDTAHGGSMAKDWLKETAKTALKYAATSEKYGRMDDALNERKKAAGLGNPEGMYLLARMYELGQGTPQNREKALALYEQAAAKGYTAAAEAKAKAEAKAEAKVEAKAKQPAPAEKPEDQLTNDERNERGLALYRAGDYEAAFRVLSPICPTRRLKLGNMKYPAAQVAMGWMRENGKGTNASEFFAFKHYSFAAEWGDLDGMRGYLRVNNNGENALRYAQTLADAGDAEAKAMLPQLQKKAREAEAQNAYDEAMKRGRAKEYEQAASLFEKAARLGHARAQFCLGVCYDFGQGVAVDKAKAAQWYEKAARLGNADAQYSLGVCYENGEGVAKDNTKAAQWYEKAARQGDASGQRALGICYANGKGVTKDFAKAKEWLEKAAQQGDENAQKILPQLGQIAQRAEARNAYDEGMKHYQAEEYEQAASLFEKAARLGHAEAQFHLGVCYDFGEGVAVDKAKAAQWYEKAAQQGIAAAQYNMGIFYSRGEGVAENKAKAVYWYEKAAQQGDAEAQCNLGVCYKNGWGVAKDNTKAAQWYEKAAQQGNAQAQYNLGLCYDNGEGVRQDKAKAVHWYEKAAQQGIAAAQCNLGISYVTGDGVSRDFAKAKEWLEKAAEQGDEDAQKALAELEQIDKALVLLNEAAPFIQKEDYTHAFPLIEKAAGLGNSTAQYILGVCYENGRGVAKDNTKAAQWYEKAAQQGVAEAQYSLGVCYSNGEGVTQDKVKAAYWYEKAAQQGHASAQFNLGLCYDNGKGVRQDKAKAAYWYEQAAQQGDAQAQYNLGYCYYYGEGVTRNRAKAKEWLQKAAAQGYEDARKVLRECF